MKHLKHLKQSFFIMEHKDTKNMVIFMEHRDSENKIVMGNWGIMQF